MKLYFSPGACSLSPHIVARELGLSIDLEQVDTKTKKTKAGADYYAVNPKGYVPTLKLDDGSILTEGPAIVQYLADQKPAAGLAPANGTPERYRLQEWLNFISTELHKGFSPLFGPQTPAEYKTQVKERLALRFQVLNDHLAKNDFLLGKSFSVADAYAFTVLSWAKYVDVDLSKFPAINAFLARVGSRPKVQEALKAEGLAA